MPGGSRDAHSGTIAARPAECSRSMRRPCCCRCRCPRRAGVLPGEGPPGLPCGDRPGAVFGAEGVPGLPPGRPRGLRAGQAVPSRPAGQGPSPSAARPASDRPGATCPRRRPPTPCGMSRRWPPRPAGTAMPWASSGAAAGTDLPWTKMRQVYRLLGLAAVTAGPVHRLPARPRPDVVNVTRSPRCWSDRDTPVPPRPAAASPPGSPSTQPYTGRQRRVPGGNRRQTRPRRAQPGPRTTLRRSSSRLDTCPTGSPCPQQRCPRAPRTRPSLETRRELVPMRARHRAGAGAAGYLDASAAVRYDRTGSSPLCGSSTTHERDLAPSGQDASGLRSRHIARARPRQCAARAVQTSSRPPG